MQIKYLLAVRLDLSDRLLSSVYPSVLSGLDDPSDDVVGVSASALLPVAHVLLGEDPPDSVDVAALTDRLWSSLDDLVSASLIAPL